MGSTAAAQGLLGAGLGKRIRLQQNPGEPLDLLGLVGKHAGRHLVGLGALGRAAEVEPAMALGQSQLHDAPFDVDTGRVQQGEGDGTEPPQRRHLSAVDQHDGVVALAGGRLHQRDRHPPRRGGGVFHRLDRLVGHHGGPQRGARGQVHLEKLLGGVIDEEGGCRPIRPVAVEDQRGIGQSDAGPRHLDVLVGDGVEFQPGGLAADRVGLRDAAAENGLHLCATAAAAG